MILTQVIRIFQAGYAQRLAGTRVVGNLSVPFYHGQEAVQRVLTATGSIPRYLLSSLLGKTWTGFIVYGYDQTFIRHHFGIMNLPVTSLLCPEDWLLLTHEVGHEYGHLCEILGNDSESLWSGEGNVFEEKRFIWDLFACLFDYRYAFGADLSAYLEHMWSRAGENDDPASWFVKCAVVYLYHIDKVEISPAILDQLRPMIGAMDKNRLLGEVADWEETVGRINRCAKYLPLFSQHLPEMPRKARRPLFSRRLRLDDRHPEGLDSQVDSLMKGIPVSAAEDPLLLLRLLVQRMRTVNDPRDRFRATIAALLTLWHWGVSHPRPSNAASHR